LRELLVVEPDIAVQRGFQFLTGSEMVALKHLLDPAVETLDHAARHCPRTNGGQWLALGRFRRGQAVLDAELGAERVELVRARRGALAQAEEAVGELGAVIGQNGADTDRADLFQVA
jgi:hypothetical protein